MKRLFVCLCVVMALLSGCGGGGSAPAAVSISDSYNSTVSIVRTVNNVDGSTTIYYSDGSVKTITGSFNNTTTAR